MTLLSTTRRQSQRQDSVPSQAEHGRRARSRRGSSEALDKTSMKRASQISVLLLVLSSISAASESIAELTGKTLSDIRKEFEGEIAKAVFSFPDDLSDGTDAAKQKYRSTVGSLRRRRDEALQSIDTSLGMLAKYSAASELDKVRIAFITIHTLFSLYQYERELSEVMSARGSSDALASAARLRTSLLRVRADLETARLFSSELMK